MPIAPKRFFDFCASHVPLLSAIAAKPGDVSEAQVRQLIRTHSDTTVEQPETTWDRLLELQILVPLEEGSSHYVIAQPLLQLLNYLHDDALPTSPEIIQGYTAALESARKRIASGTQAFDALSVGLAATEVDHTLRRMQEDLDATHRAVMAEVARYKADRSSVSVRERYLRIVRLMDQYVQPLVEIVRVDGQLVETLNQLDNSLSEAREAGVFAELGPMLRNERQALGRLRHMKLEDWVAHYVPQADRAPVECPPTDTVLKRTIHHVAAHPPQPAPSLRMNESSETPPDYVRLLWLNALPDALAAELPVKDLTDWMVKTYPEKGTSDALLGLSKILFDPALDVDYKHGKTKAYRTRDGVIEATTFSISKP